MEKRRFAEKTDTLDQELQNHNTLVDQYQEDIRLLEDKLASAREKQRMLVQRHIHAQRKRQAQEEIRRIESSDALFRFEEIENRIERMESEAELVNYGRKPVLEDELDSPLIDEDIEKELQRIKSSLSDDKGDDRSSS